MSLDTTQILIVVFGSISSATLFFYCMKSCKENKIRKKLLELKKRTAKKIKPIIQMTDKELREEIEKIDAKTQELTNIIPNYV